MANETNGAPAPQQVQVRPEHLPLYTLAQWAFNTFGVEGLDALTDATLHIATSLGPTDPTQPLHPRVVEIIETARATKRARDAARSAGIVLAPAGLNVRGRPA